MVLIIFAALAVGLFIFLQKKKVDIKTSFIISAVAFISTSIVYDGIINKNKTANSVPEVVVEAPVVASEPIANTDPIEEVVIEEKDLGIKPEAFRKNYNAVMAELKVQDRLPKLKIEEGDVNDVFTTSLTNNHALMGTISKDSGNLKGIVLIFKPESYSEDGGNGAVANWAYAASIDKAISGNKNGGFIVEMMTETMNQYKETGESVEIKNNIGEYHYSSSFSPVVGFWFSISPAQ